MAYFRFSRRFRGDALDAWQEVEESEVREKLSRAYDNVDTVIEAMKIEGSIMSTKFADYTAKPWSVV